MKAKKEMQKIVFTPGEPAPNDYSSTETVRVSSINDGPIIPFNRHEYDNDEEFHDGWFGEEPFIPVLDTLDVRGFEVPKSDEEEKRAIQFITVENLLRYCQCVGLALYEQHKVDYDEPPQVSITTNDDGSFDVFTDTGEDYSLMSALDLADELNQFGIFQME